MGLFSKIKEILDDRKYNQELYKSGKANKNEVVKTTIGWRPDPWNKEDGFTPDAGNDKDLGIDKVTGHTIRDTPSGNDEYHRIIRSNKK